MEALKTLANRLAMKVKTRPIWASAFATWIAGVIYIAAMALVEGDLYRPPLPLLKVLIVATALVIVGRKSWR